jgi:23S rRNA (pseudouridine1915-N3)-methyltransferase
VRVVLITASNKQPRWIDDGYAHYARRLDRRVSLELVEVALARRTVAASVAKAIEDESRRMLRRIPGGARVIALSVDGKPWSTEQLAAKLDGWQQTGTPVALLIGGPDGLGSECLARATERWSLSPLTLPHGLVRVTVAEALYRAASLLQGHPYHRA